MDLPEHGDFFTAELLGKPLIARNERGSIRVFLNVCAHRHALLTHAPRGSGKRLRCQYHGWEYDGDGVACKIPDAACFVPIRRGAERLRAVRAEVLGQLLLVCLDDNAPRPREDLGERVVAMIEQHFSPGLRQAVSLSLEHPCNWKIPLENFLESYHVPSLHDNFVARHTGLFRLFRGEHHGQREVHELTDRFTTVRDTLGADSALYRGLLARLHPGASTDFVHLHAFPSLLLGHTSVVSFLRVTSAPPAGNQARAPGRTGRQVRYSSTPRSTGVTTWPVIDSSSRDRRLAEPSGRGPWSTGASGSAPSRPMVMPIGLRSGEGRQGDPTGGGCAGE